MPTLVLIAILVSPIALRHDDSIAAPSIADDAPVDGATTASISSNWAYDHVADISAHDIVRTTTYVIVANDAPANWQAQADVTLTSGQDLGAVINAALALGYRNFQLSPGSSATSFVVSTSISIPTVPFVFRGCGKGITVLTLGVNGAMFLASQTSGEIGSGGIFDLTADGNWAARSAGTFFVGYPYSFSFDNLYVYDFRDYGIFITRGTGSGGYDRLVRISNCQLDGSPFTVEISGANSNFIFNNHIAGGSYGLRLTDSLYNIISNNIFTTSTTRYVANMRELGLTKASHHNTIANNLFDVWWSDSSPASLYAVIELNDFEATGAVADTLIEGNHFVGETAAKTGAVLIRVQQNSGAAVAQTHILNNAIGTDGAAGTFVTYNGVNGLYIKNNDMGAVPPTTPVSDTGGTNTNVVISDNAGY